MKKHVYKYVGQQESGATGILNLNGIISNPIKPLSREYGYSLHTHRENCLGILYYYCYLNNKEAAHGS